jgi:hypothetical protein
MSERRSRGRARVPAVRQAAALAVVGLVVAGLGACTGTPAERGSGSPAPTGRAGDPPAPTGPTGGAAPAAGFVRACETSVYGELAADWRRHSVVAGPLAFAYLREAAGQPAGDFEKRPGGYHSTKVLVVVEAGATVTVTVPPAERRHLSLLYDPAAWKDAGTYRVADGDPVVTFEGCRPSEHPFGAEATQFNGGLVVAGSRCATLEVSTSTSAAPRRLTVSFGAGRCRGA